MAIMHPEKMRNARDAHKVLTDDYTLGTRNITVDTGFVSDFGCYETGIKDIYWHIVERYITEDAAEIGHKKWCKWLVDNPTAEVPDTLTDDY